MSRVPSTAPSVAIDEHDAGRLRLQGRWTLAHATDIGHVLHDAPGAVHTIDATGVERLDSVGVLQLLRYAHRHDLDFDHFDFRDDHHALVAAIEDVADDRPKKKREYGFAAALGRLGFAVQDNFQEIVALVSFLGENLAKLLRMLRQPRRFRITATVHHMEQVGLDAVPLVFLLSYLVGAVTAILLAGRTASAFTAQIGAMVSREEVDAIRTLGLDPVDLLVIPRLIALLVTLPLLSFLADIAGLLGGMSVGAFSLDIPPQAWMARLHDTIKLRHFLVGLSKAPVFAIIIGLIGCLEGLQVKGTAQSVGERTTSSVVQTISLVIVLDAVAAIWFMNMGW